MKYYSAWWMMLATFIVFIALNLIENLIQYSIGRTTDEKTIEWTSPTGIDWARIVIVMIIFAILQAVLSFGLDYLFERSSSWFTKKR